MRVDTGPPAHSTAILTVTHDMSIGPTLAHDAEQIARPTVAADIAALRVTLVGYGEVGRIFGAALAAAGVALAETFPGLDWERQAIAATF